MRITPWPLGVDALELPLVGYVIAQQRFDNVAQFQQVFDNAEKTTLPLRLAKR